MSTILPIDLMSSVKFYTPDICQNAATALFRATKKFILVCHTDVPKHTALISLWFCQFHTQLASVYLLLTES